MDNISWRGDTFWGTEVMIFELLKHSFVEYTTLVYTTFTHSPFWAPLSLSLSKHSRLGFWEREINRYVTDTLDGSLIFFLPYIEDRGPTKRTKNVLCMSSVTVFLLKKPEWGPPCIVLLHIQILIRKKLEPRNQHHLFYQKKRFSFLKLGSVCLVTKKNFW